MPFACFIEIYHWRVELIHAFFCGFTWYFVQKMNLLCYIYYAIGQSFIDVNGQILNRYLNNLDIWSHCQRSRFSRQTVSRFSLFNQRDRLYLSISKWRDKANVTSLTHFLLKKVRNHFGTSKDRGSYVRLFSRQHLKSFFFKNGPTPASLSFIFGLF